MGNILFLVKENLVNFGRIAILLVSLPLTVFPEQGSADSSTLAKVEQLIKEVEQKITVPTITVKELADLKLKNENDIILVDVREGYEQKVSMIPGSITKKQFESNPQKYKGKKIISYCTIGHRSAYYTQELTKQGLNAYNLRGSLLSWVHRQGELVDSQKQSTKKIHVYGKKWDHVPQSYQSTYKKSWLDRLRD